MLPLTLRGPGTTLAIKEDPGFVERNAKAFPHLDPDFISQICYEHQRRFNDLYPGFDLEKHAAVRMQRTAAWVKANVRYSGSEDVTAWWAFHVDGFFETGKTDRPMLQHMLDHGTWPFPPVIAEAPLVRRLGAAHEPGTPYELIEGTHRTSYLLNLLARGRISPTSLHDLIEIVDREP